MTATNDSTPPNRYVTRLILPRFVLLVTIGLCAGCATGAETRSPSSRLSPATGESARPTTRTSADPSSKFVLAPHQERVCLSLRELARTLDKAKSDGAPVPAEAYGLWGMNYLDGYIVDEAGAKDLILVGRRQRDKTAAPARPGLRLDDLILALRAMHAADYPYCSLDPEAQSIRKLQALTAGSHTASSLAELRSFYDQLKSTVGPQQVVIGGVPRDSRWGHVMIEADYHMKKVSQGHIALTGVTSYLDLAMEQASKAVLAGRTAEATKCSMARFWFHVEADAPTFDEARDIVYIDRCAVVVLTEKQAATSSGRLHDVTEDDPLAGAFARSLSDEFAALTASVPIYADLENLFRLRALTLAAAFRTAPARVGLAPATLADGYKSHDDKTMPPSLPGLANSREATVGAYLLCPMVMGGVGQDMTVDETSFKTLHRSRLFSLRMAALMARPSNESVVWVVREAA